MRKVFVMAAIWLLVFQLAGCHGKASGSGGFPFPLPEGFGAEKVTETAWDLIRDGERIGGFVLTDLDAGCLDDLEDAALHKYLESCVPAPMIGEYIAMRGDTFVLIQHKISDPETGEAHEYDRYLFEKDSVLTELWLDEGFAEEQTEPLLDSVGLK